MYIIIEAICIANHYTYIFIIRFHNEMKKKKWKRVFKLQIKNGLR